MACAVSSTSLLSLNPRPSVPKSPSAPMALSSLSKPFSQTLTIPSNFNTLRHSFQSPRSFSSRRSHSDKRSFVVRAGELPLVGNAAPDFEAEAVFDQEFINVKLSDYKGKKYFLNSSTLFVEITAFSDRYAEFEKLNTEVLGVSVDSVGPSIVQLGQ
ncbi:hypothetical protein Cgig2_016335 [Carnegiea gigantea]|uniref:Alkyl hydroperoxide reductase subunit C/ Thiol specific antioxidant domain-containing protein n=1 Tax=Carnegiea gigantea TaxID=171969 RepID=A0A9Q1JVH7_9CARY|nr:hypothetical protein Cgig2_016335 [Carnegiea gigantea]